MFEVHVDIAPWTLHVPGPNINDVSVAFGLEDRTKFCSWPKPGLNLIILGTFDCFRRTLKSGSSGFG